MLHPDNDGIDHINIYTKGKTTLGRMLSNLAEIPVIINDNTHKKLKLSCMEAYWYLKKLETGYKVGNIPEYETWLDIRDYLKTIEGQNSFNIKKIGREAVNTAISKYGMVYKCFNPNENFKKCILKALEDKIRNNKELLELVKNNSLPYAHYYHNPYYAELGPRITPDPHKWQTEGIQKICDEIKNPVKILTHDEYISSVALANKWATAYYVNDNPIATDDEYDTLMREIKHYEYLNPEDIDLSSPTLHIGGMVYKSGTVMAAHGAKMWSMEDIFTSQELQAWMLKTPSSEYVIEPKFDGVSLNIAYMHGKLQLAITRGDGYKGWIVTRNALQIAGIPPRIPYEGLIEIRGEVVIPVGTFEILNQERLDSGEPVFANPRNAAAGTLRQYDSSLVKRRGLLFIPWGIGKTAMEFKTHSERISFIKEQGFTGISNFGIANYSMILKNYDDIMDMYNTFIKMRPTMLVALDGMVVKVNDVQKQEEYGYTNKYPKWMIAFKFPAVEKTSRLLAVEPQVGRTGVITPVARIEPVNIDGALVSNVTLHNYTEIVRKDLRIGDYIIVVRSGDVIPKILKSIPERRDGSEVVVVKITHCPECRTEIVHGDMISKCPNIECKARAINRLTHFVSRGAMNIDGLADKTLRVLYNNGIVTKFIDIFTLADNKAILETLEGFQDKKINNLLTSIDNHREVKLSKLIFALGIEKIGEKAALDLAYKLGEKWLFPELNDIADMDGFGKELCSSYIGYMDQNREELKLLLEHLTVEYDSVKISDSIYNGKTVVLTGTFDKPRDIVKGIFESNGAKVASSVSKKTDYLIYGENHGSKYDDAKRLGIECISYKDCKLDMAF